MLENSLTHQVVTHVPGADAHTVRTSRDVPCHSVKPLVPPHTYILPSARPVCNKDSGPSSRATVYMLLLSYILVVMNNN